MTPELETKDLEIWEREREKEEKEKEKQRANTTTEWNNRYLSVMITVKYLYEISIES